MNRDTRDKTHCCNARVVCEHQATNSVVHWYIWTFLCQSYLDTGWTPRYKCCESSFSDTKQTLVDICWVDFSLNYVEDGDVAALLAWCGGDHAVLRLKETSHNVENCSLANSLGLFNIVPCEWCVRGHEEVTAGRRN
jgi:hypothetical protein